MRTSVKLILTALAASLLLSAMVSTASARNLSISNQNIRVTWSSLEFVSVVTVRCRVTLEGSFHTRTITKEFRRLIGSVTKAQVHESLCTNGTGSAFNGVERYNGTTSPNTLPWHVTYEGFTGTLPNIVTVRILLSRFRFGIEALGCAVQVGNETESVTGSASVTAGAISTLVPVAGRDRATIIRTDRDPFGLCPRPGNTGVLAGTGNVTLLGSAARLTITLI